MSLKHCRNACWKQESYGNECPWRNLKMSWIIFQVMSDYLPQRREQMSWVLDSKWTEKTLPGLRVGVEDPKGLQRLCFLAAGHSAELLMRRSFHEEVSRLPQGGGPAAVCIFIPTPTDVYVQGRAAAEWRSSGLHPESVQGFLLTHTSLVNTLRPASVSSWLSEREQVPCPVPGTE